MVDENIQIWKILSSAEQIFKFIYFHKRHDHFEDMFWETQNIVGI